MHEFHEHPSLDTLLAHARRERERQSAPAPPGPPQRGGGDRLADAVCYAAALGLAVGVFAAAGGLGSWALTACVLVAIATGAVWGWRS